MSEHERFPPCVRCSHAETAHRGVIKGLKGHTCTHGHSVGLNKIGCGCRGYVAPPTESDTSGGDDWLEDWRSDNGRGALEVALDLLAVDDPTGVVGDAIDLLATFQERVSPPDPKAEAATEFECHVDNEGNADRDRASMQPTEEPAPEPKKYFVCQDCEIVAVDEDGCCVTCGRDAPLKDLPAVAVEPPELDARLVEALERISYGEYDVNDSCM